MAFQHPGDARNRRNILQGLQQTRSRLQRLHSDDPSSRSSPSMMHPTPLQKGSHMPVYPQPQQPSVGKTVSLTAPSRAVHSSPSPNEYSYLMQQQKLAMQQASAQSYSFFIPQPSMHGNLLMPVLPRFESSGQLNTSAPQ